jgi:phosphate transport system substrate-binding protein
MKNITRVLLGAWLALNVLFGQNPAPKPLNGTVSVSGAWALYPMVLKWSEEFRKVHPAVKIDVQAGGAGKGMTDALSGMADFGMVSRDIHSEEAAKGAVGIAVTKDAVIATVSAKNPFLARILKKGVTRQQFIDIWITAKAKTWEQLFGQTGTSEIRVFTRSDACGAGETWAAYVGKKQEDLGGIGVYGDPGLADAILRDRLGIGYNNVNYAYDAKTLRPVNGLAVVPIDIDGNGKVDDREDFYGTRDDLTRAIAAGIYPSPPARELFLVSKGRPANPVALEFLKWILTDGQKYVSETGYIPLTQDRLKDGLDRIK